MLQRALLLIGCSCAIEHENLWLRQLQSLGDANPIRLRETSFLISGEVLTPQTHALRHAIKTCPLNPPYPAPTLSLDCEQLHRMDFVDEYESSCRGAVAAEDPYLMACKRTHAAGGVRAARACKDDSESGKYAYFPHGMPDGKLYVLWSGTREMSEVSRSELGASDRCALRRCLVTPLTRPNRSRA